MAIQATRTELVAVKEEPPMPTEPAEATTHRLRFSSASPHYYFSFFSLPTTTTLFCITSLILTGYSSWDCSFLQTTSSSSSYGLWTLADNRGECQLWYVAFCGWQLDGPIKTAQACSMMAHLLGLGVAAVVVGWPLGIALLLLGVPTLLGVGHRPQFNVWVSFFCVTYWMVVLFVIPSTTTTTTSSNTTQRQQQQQRRCSTRMAVCAWASAATAILVWSATLSAVKSPFCQCASVTNMVQGSPLEFEDCVGDPGGSSYEGCELGHAGGTMIGTGFVWMFTGLLLWIQRKQQSDGESEMEQQQRPGCEITEGETDQETTSVPVPILSVEFEPSIIIEDQEARTKRERNNNASVELCGEQNDNTIENIPEDDEDDEDMGEKAEGVIVPSKSWSRRICCTARQELTQQQRFRLYSYRFFRCALFCLYLAIILLLLGSHAQNNNAAKKPDTSYNFITDTVCAFHPLDASAPFTTFASKQQALDAGYEVAHCGACGQCSNPHDLRRYIDTRKTVAYTAKTCGKYTVLGSEDALHTCLQDKIDFTPQCTDCWVENMKTTARYCMVTCISTLLNGYMGNNNIEGFAEGSWMNQCFYCDEKRSGPAFVRCSGVARRRLGISSAILRNPQEQCSSVDLDWTSVDMEEVFAGYEY